LVLPAAACRPWSHLAFAPGLVGTVIGSILKQIIFAALIAAACATVCAQVAVNDPWVRATVAQQKAPSASAELHTMTIE
jgi:hypothetical protein